MQLPKDMERGILLKRYKRFLADIRLDTGEEITAHCANPGAMTGLKDEGSRVWVSKSNNPKRKLAWSWELIEADNVLVGIHTAHPNAIAEEAILAGKIPALAGYETLRREVKYGANSRIDILLQSPDRPDCYVEIKNVHLKRARHATGPAEFPDAVTTRGAKHLMELSNMVKDGARAVMLYLVQRPDCSHFTLAHDIDPGYHKAWLAAQKAGVESLCYDCDITSETITIRKSLDIRVEAGH